MSLLNGGCGCGGTCSSGAGAEPDAAGENGTSRRRFLKVLGASGAGAATMAACGPPDFADKLIPSLVEEEGITPGVSDTYATVLPDAGPEPVPVHAQVRDGRVLGLSPNDRFGGGTRGLSSLTHSALQDLYDPDRVSQPLRRNPSTEEGAPPFQFASWEDATAALTDAVRVGGAVLLTGRVTGTTGRFIADWAEVMGVEHIAWEPFSSHALAAGTSDVNGGAGTPRFDLSGAGRIACFGADFLGTWLAPTQLAAGFAAARDIDAGRHAKFTFVGPRLSLTGANADEWIEARGGTEGAVAFAVAGVVAAARGTTLPAGVPNVSPESAADAAGVPADSIRALGEELASAESPVAIPPGIESQGADARRAHAAVAALNEVLGAVGRSVFPGGGAPEGTTASFADMQALIGRMRAGQVRTLIVAGANPAYALPAAAGFGAAMANVANTIAIGPHLDETASACGWVLPCHHALESWCDAELADGAMALGQPLMHPVFDTRQREDLLLAVANAAGQGGAFSAADYATVLRNAWTARLGGDGAWLDALRLGGATAAAWSAGDGAAGDTMAGDTMAPMNGAGGAGGFAPPEASPGTHLVVYPTAQFYDGRGANRSWMQEQPDAITKAVWNSWVELHPDMAENLGVKRGDLVRVESGQGAIEAPAYVYRGIRPDTVAIPLGQGHTEYGRHARGRGVNPLDLLPAAADPGSGALAYAGTTVTVTAAGGRGQLVVTQGSTDDLDREIVHAMNVDDALREVEAHEIDLVELVEAAWDSDPNSPYRWGMVIDLNNCTGCGACVTSCYSENNIPTVGEEQVALRREMSWMRIHRFEEATDDGGFQTVQQPMLCQHCGDAPCEPVCPVYATYHNPEGLNVQVYNRCVGTRYCANNCPYKVRRFNWFNYDAPGRGDDRAFPWPLNLQLNPDITVREVGVMEKCTMCVQRINKAKIDAKDEGRTLVDGEVVTACQSSCPSNAITFGNLKDPNSDVSRRAKSVRGYHALGELGVRPAITYLEDVTHRHMASGHGEPAAAGEGEEAH